MDTRFEGPLLRVDHLRIRFATPNGTVHAVENMSFAIDAGMTLAIVGESGCGKSVTAMSILGLVPTPPATIEGVIAFDGYDTLSVPERQRRSLRGNEISMIFQEPATSLNPVLTIGRQLREVMQLHMGLTRRQADKRAVEMLELVGIPEAHRRLQQYPHQLSGGMRQRVMIAMALACRPRLLIADEPTTALDVTIQAQILDLMRNLKQQTGSALLLITHDLGVVAEMAEQVIIMYAGRKVEEAGVLAIFKTPLHPYTRGLLAAVPKLGEAHGGPLNEISGNVPSLLEPIVGCAFAPRCAFATDICRTTPPPLEEKLPGHIAACHHTDRVLAA